MSQPEEPLANSDKSFSNSAVVLDDMSVATLELNSISGRYRLINVAICFSVSTLVCFALWVLYRGWIMPVPDIFITLGPWVISGVAVLGLIYVGYHFFADPIIKYTLREQDLHFQSGLFFRRIVSQPILRIQHIELKRGPIERKANLATLQVFSAGGTSHTFEIPGLSYQKAVSLRQFIIDHKDLSVDE